MNKGWRSYIESIVIAVIIALFIRSFVITVYRVPTSTMSPTLKAGDLIAAYRLPFGVKVPFTEYKFGGMNPRQGEVVVFRFPSKGEVKYVKRVVGLPGDRIQLQQGVLWVNDKRAEYFPVSKELISDLPGNEYSQVYKEVIDENEHLVMFQEKRECNFGPVVVPAGQVFVLGDNRDSSDDSRDWGMVPIERIEGRIVLILLSFNWHDRWAEDRLPLVRWNRFFHTLK